MKILRVLLKLFPRSFQKQMGEAWLEAAEQQIQEKKSEISQSENRVVLAFVLETLFVVLPHAYRLSFTEDVKNDMFKLDHQQLLPKKKKSQFDELVEFVFDYGHLCLLSFCICIYWAFIIIFDLPLKVFVIPLVCLGLFYMLSRFQKISLFVKRIYTQEEIGKRFKEILFVCFHVFLGAFLANCFLMKIMLNKIEQDDMDAFYQYRMLHEQFDFTKNPANISHEQWCTVSIARLETLSQSMSSTTDQSIRSLLIGSHWSLVYGENCWSTVAEQKQYTASRLALSSDAFKKSKYSKKWWSTSPTLLWVFKNYLKNIEQKVLYSPYDFCLDQMNWEWGQKNKDVMPQSVVALCTHFSDTTSLSLATEKDVREFVQSRVQEETASKKELQ